MKRLRLPTLLCACSTLWAQQPTTFARVGDGGDGEQEFFNGTHRARAVLGAYTNEETMGLFCGGQDLAGTADRFAPPFDRRWGDQGNGTFANPVIAADYSDPDVIRVGDKYYMTCSEFHYMGIPILVSDDMVNWSLLTQVYDSIEGYDGVDRYGEGSWAPALRYHQGRFYLYFCTPNDGLYMTSAADAAGPWEPLHQVRKVKGWEDPCPLWDDKGNAYLGRSALGGGPIIIHKMSEDGRTLLDQGREVYHGPTAEGTKLFMKDGKYYLSIPEGGVGNGWQSVGMADNVYGPYAMRRVLERGSTDVNGPHQGALVDTPEGQWWFYHFQSFSPLGRVTHLQPVQWVDGYPVIGEDYDGNGIGEPVKICQKPTTTVKNEPYTVATSDNFDNFLGLQWQTNHNPDKGKYGVEDGRLYIEFSKADRLRQAPNQLTQKIMGFSGTVTVKLSTEDFSDKARAGITLLGNKTIGFGVRDYSGTPLIYLETDGEVKSVAQGAPQVWLRLSYDVIDNTFQFSYSLDGETFKNAKTPYDMGDGDWKGVHVGLFAYTQGAAKGHKAYFDDFVFTTDHKSHSQQ